MVRRHPPRQKGASSAARIVTQAVCMTGFGICSDMDRESPDVELSSVGPRASRKSELLDVGPNLTGDFRYGIGRFLR